MRYVHFCAGLQQWNGMANVARMLMNEQLAFGDESVLINSLENLEEQLERGADVVFIHGAWLPILWRVARTVKRRGVRLVLMPHGSYDPLRRRYHGWKKSLVGCLERLMIGRADKILATCAAEEQWIRQYFGKGCPAIEIMDIKRFFQLADCGAVDKRQQVDSLIRHSANAPLHLLFLGRRHPLKGLKYLEESIKGIPGIELQVVSHAFGEEKERVWDWCDVLVLPTLSENFGLVIAEALEHGKRVITTDGAPAWGDGCSYGRRLTYITGYRDGSVTERIKKLKTVIESLVRTA